MTQLFESKEKKKKKCTKITKDRSQILWCIPAHAVGNLPCWMWSRAGGRRLQQGRLCFLQLNLGGSVLCREGRTSSVWRHQKNGQRWNIILGFQVGWMQPFHPCGWEEGACSDCSSQPAEPFQEAQECWNDSVQ